MTEVPNTVKRSAQRRWPLEIIVALVISALGFGAYWAHPSRGKEVRLLWHRFYRPLPQQGLSFDGSHCLAHLENGQFTEWTYLINRAAYKRWQLRETAPHGLAELTERWQDGLWNAPTQEQWETAFEKFDAQWQEQREKYPAEQRWDVEELAADGWTFWSRLEDQWVAKDKLSNEYGVVADKLTAPSGLKTAALGSRISFRFASDKGVAKPERKIYWTTQALGESGMRVKTGVSKYDEKTGGYVYTFDFSNEPGWMAPKTEIHTFRFESEGFRFQNLVAIEGADSPNLAR